MQQHGDMSEKKYVPFVLRNVQGMNKRQTATEAGDIKDKRLFSVSPGVGEDQHRSHVYGVNSWSC